MIIQILKLFKIKITKKNLMIKGVLSTVDLKLNQNRGI
jgi:hypothetical protein